MKLNRAGLVSGLEMLVSIKRLVDLRSRVAEQRLGESEAEMLAYRKLGGFVNSEIDDFRAQLAMMDEEKPE